MPHPPAEVSTDARQSLRILRIILRLLAQELDDEIPVAISYNHPNQ